LAPEILGLSKFKQLDKAVDIFSLGLSILEILCKVELPQSGVLWKQIRSEGFMIPEEFLKNSNLKNIPNEMLMLIKEMIIVDPSKRPGIEYFIENYRELKIRNYKLLNKDYKRILDPDLIFPIEELPFKYAKRSDSYKTDL
jgi:serine/threonine protein kinase